MSIVLMGSTSGSCTLQEQAVAGTTTLTLPTTSGTVALTSDIVAPTTAQVLAATAGATWNSVGTYIFAANTGNTTDTLENATRAGSTLRSAGVNPNGTQTANILTGTWRCMGILIANTGINSAATVWVRIS
jgi:hypothetical protein